MSCEAQILTADQAREEILTELKWKKFSALDDGFICLVDAMGDDSSVVQAARVSYGAGTKKVSNEEGVDSVSDAEQAHDAVRNGGVEVYGPCPHGYVETVDSPQDGERERVQHEVLGSDRQPAADASGGVESTGDDKQARIIWLYF
jgi:hypothetical protein